MVKVDSLKWGSIVVDGNKYRHDLIIPAEGTVRRRKSMLGSLIGHTFKKEEIEGLVAGGAEVVVVGTGTSGRAHLSEEAKRYVEQAKQELVALPSKEAAQRFNQLLDSGRKAAAIIHIT